MDTVSEIWSIVLENQLYLLKIDQISLRRGIYFGKIEIIFCIIIFFEIFNRFQLGFLFNRVYVFGLK